MNSDQSRENFGEQMPDPLRNPGRGTADGSQALLVDLTELLGQIQEHAHGFAALAHLLASEGEFAHAEFMQDQAEHAKRLMCQLREITRP